MSKLENFIDEQFKFNSDEIEIKNYYNNNLSKLNNHIYKNNRYELILSILDKEKLKNRTKEEKAEFIFDKCEKLIDDFNEMYKEYKLNIVTMKDILNDNISLKLEINNIKLSVKNNNNKENNINKININNENIIKQLKTDYKIINDKYDKLLIENKNNIKQYEIIYQNKINEINKLNNNNIEKDKLIFNLNNKINNDNNNNIKINNDNINKINLLNKKIDEYKNIFKTKNEKLKELYIDKNLINNLNNKIIIYKNIFSNLFNNNINNDINDKLNINNDINDNINNDINILSYPKIKKTGYKKLITLILDLPNNLLTYEQLILYSKHQIKQIYNRLNCEKYKRLFNE